MFERMRDKFGFVMGNMSSAVLTGIVVSLSLGFVDLAVDVASGQTKDIAPETVILSLAVTVALFFVLYTVVWYLCIKGLGRLMKLNSMALAVSFGLFVGIAFVLALLNGLIKFSPSPDEFQKLIVLLLASVICSVLSYFIIVAISEMPPYSEKAPGLVLTIPFLIAEYALLSITAASSFLTGVIFLFCACLTALLFLRQDRTMRIRLVVMTFLLILVLAPLSALIASVRATTDRGKVFQLSEHKINHVILITIDSLRSDTVSAYSPGIISTPHIDSLANDGILFTRVISPAPWTLPSLSSLMTGLAPDVHMTKTPTSMLPHNVETLAQYMQTAGYYTGAIVFNPYLKLTYGMAQGFLDYDVYPRPLTGKSLGGAVLRKISSVRYRQLDTTSDITNSAIAWIKSKQSRDFFLWIHYLDPHMPYAPPAEFLPKGDVPPRIGVAFGRTGDIQAGHFNPTELEREWIRALYNGEARYVDRSIGRLLDFLKQMNLYDGSLIILTADHGEEFWDHNSADHGHTVYNELLHVPLIIKLPSSSSKIRVEKVVQTHSVMPTVLDLCGISYDSKHLSTSSLRPLWGKDPKAFGDQPVVSTALLRFEDREALTLDGLKYIHYLVSSHEELYDLTADPSERFNIANRNAAFIQKAKAILKQYHARSQELRNYYQIEKTNEIKLDQKTIQDLKSLGYVR